MLSNNSGTSLEKIIEHHLGKKGFNVVKHKDWEKRPYGYSKELLLTNVPYVNLYGTKSRTEFLLKSSRFGINCRIECKWQQVSGSVDEKYPYLYLNCLTMPEDNIVIVIDGDGYRKEARQWLSNAASNRYYQKDGVVKDIKILSLSEFIAWANYFQ